MKKPLPFFLVWLTAVLIPAGLFLLYMEAKLPDVPNSYNQKKKIFEKKAALTECLIVGASQSLYGLNPAVMKKNTYNFSLVNQSLYYDVALIKKYLPRMKKLKKIILPSSYFTPGYELETTNEAWRVFFYQNVFEIAPLNSSFTPKSFSWYFLYGNSASLYFLRNGFTDPGIPVIDSLGFQAVSNKETQKDNLHIAEEDAKRHALLLHFKWYILHEFLMCELLKDLQDNGIELILVNMPVRPFYKSALNPSIKYLHQSFIKKLSAFKNFKYLDYSTNHKLTSEQFLDHYHLNYKGAWQFSAELSRQIEEID